MKIYNITEGQLIIYWLFGLILLFLLNNQWQECSLTTARGCEYIRLWGLVFGFILAFYTVGWHSSRKKQDN